MAENTIITTTQSTTTEVKLERANRVAVQSTATGFKADFYRTHKHLATLMSEDTTWQADESANKSAQREDFRKFAIEHSADIGILWTPADLRADSNKRIAKYESDGMLIEDAINLLWDDLWNLTRDCGLGVEFDSLTVGAITPVTHSAKGTDLSKLGIIDGKYEKSGNWAWADVEMSLNLSKEGQEIYFLTTCQLVSGQLKKPHITKTAFTESIKESLKEIGLWQEESKEEVKAEETPAEESKVEDKPKTTKGKGGKKSKKAETSAE